MLTFLLKTLFIFCSLFALVMSVIVSTKYGKIEGLTTSYPNASGGQFKSVSKFLGVPFAAPPIGELRFKAPRPPNEWKPNVLQTKKNGNICLQIAFSSIFEGYIKLYTDSPVYSEDCLYLDVYTPNISLSLPVMVYIHGGAYEFGTSVFSPSDILALHGVVVVVIQYRLGPFGFLTTGDSAAPGNFGMLDQVEALKWVKENIKNFGGNPSNVTIFGESAGGSSVSLHLMSPRSNDLFHQAIAESGVDLSRFAIQPTSLGVANAKALAEKLNCATNDHNAMVACLRKKAVLDIKKAADLLAADSAGSSQSISGYLSWAPVVDNNFLSDTPQNLRKEKKFKQVPLMISFNSQESSPDLGLVANMSFFGLMESVSNGVSPAFFKTFLKKLAQSQKKGNIEHTDLITDAMEFMYTPWPDNSDKYELRTQLVDLIGDIFYFAPSHKVAEIHSQVAPVYMYEFAHRRIKNNPNPIWMGVAHADNIPYDFGVPLLPKFWSGFDEADRNVSLFIMAMYRNFATSGNPTVSGVTWDNFNSTHRAYLLVDVNPKMKASFNPRRMAFWNDYMPKLEQLKFDATDAIKPVASASVTMGTVVQIVFVIILAMML